MAETTLPNLSRPRRWLAVGLFLLVLCIATVAGWLALAGCAPFAEMSAVLASFLSLSGLTFAALGGLILVYQPDNRVGWLCSWAGIGVSSTIANLLYVDCGLAGHLQLPGLGYAAWLGYGVLGLFVVVPMFILLPMLFPTGRFLSPRWRRLAVVGTALLSITSVAMALVPDFSQTNAFGSAYPITNPFGLPQVPGWWLSVFGNTAALIAIFLSLMGLVSMILRMKRSHGDELQQMKWLAYFLTTSVAVQLVVFELPGAFVYPQIFETIWYELIIFVVFVGFPVTIGIAIFRYRLYEIDVLIRRTLLYSTLTALLALIYLGSVVLLQSIFAAVGGGQSPLAIVLSTLAIAALFNPLRRRLQEVIDRRFYRQKYDAARALAGFTATARNEVDLEALTSELVRVVENALQPNQVSFWLSAEPDGARRQNRGARAHAPRENAS